MSKVSTQFKTCNIVEDFTEIHTEIHPGYKFSCLKGIYDGANPFIVCKTYKGKVVEIYREDEYSQESVENLVRMLSNENDSLITDKLLVAGCHTVVNLKNRLEIGKEPIEALRFSLDLMEGIRQTKGIHADFMIPLNDFFMEHDPSTTSDKADNKYRQEAVQEYILPVKAQAVLEEHEGRTGIKVSPLYCSEKGMADRFNRHIKNRKKDSEMFLPSESGLDWYMRHGDDFIPVIQGNKPNCVAGNAATERATRYNITPNKQFDHYTSRIGIYPRCSMKNVLDGYRVACSVYDDFDMPGYFVFFGGSCA